VRPAVGAQRTVARAAQASHCSSNNGHNLEQTSGEALVTGESRPFYCLLPWDAAACESPEGICWKDHLRRRNRRPRAQIHRPDLLVVNPVFAVVARHIQPDRCCFDTSPPNSLTRLIKVCTSPHLVRR
jgi:hypothetical protein